MSTPTPPPPRRAARGTRAPYERGDQREAQILDSLDELLRTTPLTGISVDHIAKGAGISRPTLYFYYRSRSEVFVALLRRTLAELSTPPQDLVDAAPELTPRAEIAALLRHVLRSWQDHGAVLRAVVEAADDPAADAVWRQAMEAYAHFLEGWIERHRAQGTAVDTGDDPADLAAALTWMVERNNYRRFRAGTPTGAEIDRHLDTLTGIVLRAIGITDPA
ncbi:MULTISPECIES: TetR/AcrR family transcriptional regulator [unclassified Nocardiopsis]|uniref:TetR/AcrR family transcriptional regulator n=1 Tax=unclassified Nocardiopsis TaxID=2649073 RepID=UPI0033FAE067